MKKIIVLGSTGSIGKQVLQVAAHLPDALEVVGLVAGSNSTLLIEQARQFNIKVVGCADYSQKEVLKQNLPHTSLFFGSEGIEELVATTQADLVVSAMVGTAGLVPTLAAIETGKSIALANKEILVAAGKLVTEKAKQHNVQLIPIDSEHSALFQALGNQPLSSVRRMILTASGGPFRNTPEDQLASITVEQALRHNYAMGPKITVDCSTLMNKGLEYIEAHWLFSIPLAQLSVVIHPQSIIHSLVEFIDGSMLAQMGIPSMLPPIQYALTYPERKPGILPPFDFLKHPELSFSAPDVIRFPCLRLAQEAVHAGGSAACYLNAANEILVNRFLNRKLNWPDIGIKLEKLMTRHTQCPLHTVQDVLEMDTQARHEALHA